MKKIKNSFAVLLLCCMCAGVMKFQPTTSKIFAGIAYGGNVNRNQGAVITAANMACDVCLHFALVGSGATAGASLVVGLALTA